MPGFCEICGNERVKGKAVCPFCGSRHQTASTSRGAADRHRVINLERGLPVVEKALDRLEIELDRARLEGVGVVTVIHGYGSSGKGGKIRDEVRSLLGYMVDSGRIRSYICGERFSKKDGQTRMLLRRFAVLARHESLGKGNRGITFVEL